ncbi:unnamed protein product [Prunus armeniaca]
MEPVLSCSLQGHCKYLAHQYIIALVKSHDTFEMLHMAIEIEIPFEWRERRCRELHWRGCLLDLIGERRGVYVLYLLAQGILQVSSKLQASKLIIHKSLDVFYSQGLQLMSVSPMMWASLIDLLIDSGGLISSVFLPARRIGGLSLREIFCVLYSCISSSRAG